MQNWTKGHIFTVTGGSINVRPPKPNHVFSYKRADVSFNFGKKEAFYFRLKWFNLPSFSVQAVFFIRGERKSVMIPTRARLKKQIFLILHSLPGSHQTAGAEKSPEERSAVPVLIKTPETRAGEKKTNSPQASWTRRLSDSWFVWVATSCTAVQLNLDEHETY